MAIVESAVDAIISIDQRGTIETFNRSAEKIFGYQRSDVIGKNVNVLMPEPDHRGARLIHRALPPHGRKADHRHRSRGRRSAERRLDLSRRTCRE